MMSRTPGIAATDPSLWLKVGSDGTSPQIASAKWSSRWCAAMSKKEVSPRDMSATWDFTIRLLE